MIDKKIYPVYECNEEIDEGIASLPLKNLWSGQWRTVFQESLSKDVNWLGRRDRRVNGGMGKKGIHSCRITELVRGNHFI